MRTLALLLALAGPAHAGDLPDLVAHNAERRTTEIRSMAVLLGEAGLSVGSGAVGWATSEGEWRTFHQLNVVWGAANGLIGALSLRAALRDDPSAYDLAATWRRDAQIVRVFLFNVGLDVAYVATGLWLADRGGLTGEPRLLGVGRAVVIQGSFLVVFDLVMALVHGRRARRLIRPHP